MAPELTVRRTITITLEGSTAGVMACKMAMGTHIPEALNFRPPAGTKVVLNIREDFIDPSTGEPITRDTIRKALNV